MTPAEAHSPQRRDQNTQTHQYEQQPDHAGIASSTAPSRDVSRPRNTVATTRPGRVRPAYGVLRDFDASAAGEAVHRIVGSTTTRFAGSPIAIGLPWSA